MKRLTCFSIILLLGSQANAALITVNWSGTITDGGAATGTIGVGDTISGLFTYDAATTDTTISSTTLDIYDTNHSSSFSVNGLSGTTTNGNSIGIFNNSGPDVLDQFDSRTEGSATYTGDLIGGFDVAGIFVRFVDSSATVFSDTSLVSFLDPADFDNPLAHVSRLDLADGTGFVNNANSVRFQVNTFSFVSASVPEPSTLALLGAGLLGLFMRRKRVA